MAHDKDKLFVDRYPFKHMNAKEKNSLKNSKFLQNIYK